MNRQIPKFLHKTLKDTIGKIRTVLFAHGDIGSMNLTFERQWDERHVVMRRVTYQHRETIELHEVIQHCDRWGEWLDAMNNNQTDVAYAIADECIQEYEDYFVDASDGYGDVIDEDDYDQEFDEHIDSDNNIYMQGASQPREIRVELERYGSILPINNSTWYLNPLRWIFGLKLTPLTESAEARWLESRQRTRDS